ncbi:MAG: dephospho-CoA kinase [Brevinema sp.]
MRYIVGLFGRVGTGKSTVCAFFEEKNWLIISQDILGHQVLEESAQQIAEMFGSDVLENGKVNRQILGQKIFANDELRIQLMNFSYQFIIRKTNDLISKNPEKNVLIEGAFFFRVMDQIPYTHLMCTDVPNEILHERLLKRGHTEEWIQKVIASQNEILEFHSKAKFVIDNSGDLSFLKGQLETIFLYLS